MRNKLTLLIAVFILGIGFVIAQAPEAINYQAVARNLSGVPLVNQGISVRYEIRQGSSTGTAVYVEDHSLTTNQFGLFTAEIGNGTPFSGTFAGINWGSGSYYLYVEVDGNPMGATQLLSVPYALYSKESANGPAGAPGKNSLALSTNYSGALCPNGGTQVDVGLDDNDDGTLQTLEIDFTYYICNGVDGTNGVNGTNGTNGADGVDGNDGVGIVSTVDNGDGTFTINYSDATSFTTSDLTGPAGTNGTNGTTYYPGNGITFNNDTIINAGDNDNDSSNELITVTNLNGTTIEITENGTLHTIDLSSMINNNDTSVINELQTISLNATSDTIFLSNGGGYVALPAASGDTDWTQGVGVIYNTTDYVGIGNSTPVHPLTVTSTDSVISSFTSSNPDVAAISIAGSNASAKIGAIFLSGSDTGLVAMDPANKQFFFSNSTPGGQSVIYADSVASLNSDKVANVGQSLIYNKTQVIYNEADSIFDFSGSGNIVHVNQGMFLTDSLYVLGNNAANPNWVLANDGAGQAVWTDPAALGAGSSLWQLNAPDIFFNTGNVAIGTNTPVAPLTIENSNPSDLEFVGGANSDITAPGQLNIESGTVTFINSGFDTHFWNGGTDRMTILGSGNIGIGTVNPLQLLTLSSPTSTTIRMERSNAAAFDWEMNVDNLGFHLKGGANATGAGLTDFVNIDGFGKMGLGITTPTQLLHLYNGTIRIDDGANPYNLPSSDGTVSGQVLTTDGAGNTSWQLPSNSTDTMSIISDADGDTEINVEAAPDQDVIHFSLGNSTGYLGAEYFTMIGPRLEVINSGQSIFIGQGAGANDDLNFRNNLFIGHQSGNANTTGSSNVGLGVSTLESNVAGNYNIAIGDGALSKNNGGANNITIGVGAGFNNLTGSGNIFLGHQAGMNETGSNHLYIDNSNTATPLIWGNFTTNELRVNGSLNINNAYTLPTVDGSTSGQVLTTDAAGNASWQTPVVSGDNWGADTVNVTGSNIMGNGTFSNPLMVIDNDTSAINEIQNLTLTTGSGNVNIGITGGSSYIFGINDADADSTNELITNFDINGTLDSIVIDEGGNHHAIPKSLFDDGDWTKGTGSDLYNNTDSIGIGTTNPQSPIQIGNYMHFFPVNFVGPVENYAVSSYNAHYDGTTIRNTTGGTSGITILGHENGTPMFGAQLFPSQPVGGDVMSVSPILRMNLKGKGLGINEDNPAAGLHVTPVDSAAILMDHPNDGSHATLIYQAGDGNLLGLKVPSVLSSGSFELTYPTDLPASNGAPLISDLNGNLSWGTPGGTSLWTKSGADIYQTTLTDFVGIGTNTPTEMLSIGSQGTATSVGTQQGSHKLAFTGSYWNGSAVSRDFTIHNEASAATADEGRLAIGYQPTGVEIMSLTSTGRVGLGITNPVSTFNIIYTGADSEASLVNYSNNSASGNGTGYFVGVNNTGTGTIIAGAFQVGTSGNSTQTQALEANNIANGGTNYGIRSVATGSGTSNYGGNFSASGASSINTGVSSSAAAAGTAQATGVYGTVSGSTTGITYGVYGQNSASNTGLAYAGYFQNLNSSASAIHGVRSDVNSSSGNNQYGLSTYMSTASTGTKYGVFSQVVGGATNWAAYFAAGNVYVADTIVIPSNAQSGAVLTSIDATGTAVWKPRNIAFEARGTNIQNVDNVPTLLQFDAVTLDDGGNFDPSVGNYMFVVPLSGVYSIQSSVTFDYSSAGPNDITIVEMLVNGTPVYESNVPIVNGERTTNTISTTTRLSPGDIIQIRIYVVNGGAIITTANTESVWFSGHLIYAY